MSGTRIPAEATDGSVAWNRIDNVPVMGRMAMMKRRGGMASSYQCPSCPCAASFVGLEVLPSSGNVAVGSTKNFAARAYYGGCAAEYYVEPASATWWTGHTSKATVSGSGVVTGVAPGETTVHASKTDFVYVLTGQWCSIGGYPTYTDNSPVHVGDATPVITSVVPNVWPAGATTFVTINGSGFGSSPLVSFSDPTIAKTVLTKNNTKITLNVIVPASNPGTTVTITVTSQGYSGSGFVATTPGQPSSGTATGTVRIPTWVVKIADTGMTPAGGWCPFNLNAKQRVREYGVFDSMGQIPIPLKWDWILQEVVISGPCNMLTGGTDDDENTFEDVIVNCQAGCIFQSRQYFKIDGVRLKVKESPTASAYEGFLVNAIDTNVTVTGTNVLPPP